MTKTFKELAQEAILLQDGVNLSGIVHSFSQAITDVRTNLRAEGKESTANVNSHPVCILYASKIASLTNCEIGSEFHEAYKWAQEQING